MWSKVPLIRKQCRHSVLPVHLVGRFSAAVDTIYDGTPMIRVNLFNIAIRSALANCAHMEAADSRLHLLLGNVTCNEYLPYHLYRDHNRSIIPRSLAVTLLSKKRSPHHRRDFNTRIPAINTLCVHVECAIAESRSPLPYLRRSSEIIRA